MKLKRFAILLTALAFILPLHAQEDQPKPKVRTSVYHAVSQPLRDMKVILPGEMEERSSRETIENPSLEKAGWQESLPERAFGDEPLEHVQSRQGNRSLGAPFVNVEGLDNIEGVAPADPNGDVGLNYYVQTINRSFAVYDKRGNLVYGPVHNTSIWESLPGPWADVSWGGDPIFKYDHLAERWVMTAFSINSSDDQYYELVAVSTTSDPLGSYNLYAYQFDDFNDYPKLAIWHDAYYITYNMFRDGNRIEPRVTALEKDAMLAGAPEARMIEFEYSEDLSHNIPFCTDIEGYNISSDRPNYVLSPVIDPDSEPLFAALHLYEFRVDWDNPESTSFEFLKEMEWDGARAGFRRDVSQPSAIDPIDALSFRLMYPVSYRDFGTHESIVACHTLQFPDSNQFHKRWYELRRDAGEWYIYQSGSYLKDGIERWMGSINMNGKGDIALGYSASNQNIYPSVRYTGRLAGDSLNQMTIREITAFHGEAPANNVAGSRNRWGDYTSMSVDPVGDSTFWFTAMYPTYPAQWGNWTTRIVAFNLRSDASNILAEAGLDRLICDTNRIATNGFASNYSSLYWSTTGDGYFANEEAILTTYILGPDDMNSSSIKLVLHALGYAPGEEVTDTLTVHRRDNPVADAGRDTTICRDDSYMLNGSVQYADSFRWETKNSNSGTFSDIHDLHAIFTPSNLAKFRGYADLELKVFNSTACERERSNDIRISLETCTDAYSPEIEKWNVSLRPNPFDEVLSVDLRGPGNESFYLEIYDRGGRKLFNGSYRLQGGKFSHLFDLRRQPAGPYYLRVFNERMERTRQIIKG